MWPLELGRSALHVTGAARHDAWENPFCVARAVNSTLGACPTDRTVPELTPLQPLMETSWDHNSFAIVTRNAETIWERCYFLTPLRTLYLLSKFGMGASNGNAGFSSMKQAADEAFRKGSFVEAATMYTDILDKCRLTNTECNTIRGNRCLANQRAGQPLSL